MTLPRVEARTTSLRDLIVQVPFSHGTALRLVAETASTTTLATPITLPVVETMKDIEELDADSVRAMLSQRKGAVLQKKDGTPVEGFNPETLWSIFEAVDLMKDFVSNLHYNPKTGKLVLFDFDPDQRAQELEKQSHASSHSPSPGILSVDEEKVERTGGVWAERVAPEVAALPLRRMSTAPVLPTQEAMRSLNRQQERAQTPPQGGWCCCLEFLSAGQTGTSRLEAHRTQSAEASAQRR